MVEKRLHSQDHAIGSRHGGGFHANKKHKSNEFEKRNGAGGHGHGRGQTASHASLRGFHGKPDPVQEELLRLPDPDKCQPCKIATKDMETGFIALLDHVLQEETREQANKDIVKYARKLHKAMSSRANKTGGRLTKQLDNKRPEKDVHVMVPAYTVLKVQRASQLPPLPPITEPYLQEAVFTHKSANQPQPGKQGCLPQVDYERLEFLGDAYIELISSRLIYTRFPQLPPSEQSHFREQLVRNETLGRFSQYYGFGDRLKHGPHMKDSKNWIKVLADVFEAYVAAIVMSDPQHGFTTSEKWLTELWAPQLLDYKEKPMENPLAREELAKMVMVRGVKLDYKEERPMANLNGVQKYFIGVYLTGWGFENEWLASGEGQNKAAASLAAAADALSSRRKALVEAHSKKLEAYPPKPAEDTTKENEAKEQEA